MATEEELLDQLEPAFAAKIRKLKKTIQSDHGFRIVVYSGTRDPKTQAIYWRQSRTKAEIDGKIAFLREKGAPFIAGVLEGVGPHTGPAVTGVVPGLSFHQYSRAVDVYVVSPETGRALWYDKKQDKTEYDRAKQLYGLYGQAAKAAGLVWGGDWRSPFDPGHVQGQKAKTPLAEYGNSYPKLDAAMKALWG